MKIRKDFSPPPISVGRELWPELTDLPVQTFNEIIAVDLIPSFKVGRRNLILYSDIVKLFERLAKNGEQLEVRSAYLQMLADRRKAKKAAP